jgi:hypothetical protein
LEQTANAYIALNATALSAQARARSVEASTAAATAPITGTRAPYIPTSGRLPISPALDAAKAKRVDAARALQDDLLENPPKSAKDWSSDLIAELGDALIAEDKTRQTYYTQQIAQAKDVAVQIALRRDEIAWLALKYRVARGGFGATLVADWEQDRAAIVDAENAAWDEYFRLVEAQAENLPNMPDRAPAREDVIRQELLATRWGWYLGPQEQDLLAKLDEVSLKLMDAAYPELRLDTLKRNNRMIFLLLPDELYGQGEKALPK